MTEILKPDDTPDTPGAQQAVATLVNTIIETEGSRNDIANSNVSHVSPHAPSDTLSGGGAGYGNVRDMGDGTVGVGGQTH